MFSLNKVDAKCALVLSITDFCVTKTLRYKNCSECELCSCLALEIDFLTALDSSHARLGAKQLF